MGTQDGAMIATSSCTAYEDGNAVFIAWAPPAAGVAASPWGAEHATVAKVGAAYIK